MANGLDRQISCSISDLAAFWRIFPGYRRTLRVVNDKKYFANLFKLGALRRVDLAEAPMKKDRWEMIVITNQGAELQVETARGEAKTFASLEAARQFAQDIGFKKMEISW